VVQPRTPQTCPCRLPASADSGCGSVEASAAAAVEESLLRSAAAAVDVAVTDAVGGCPLTWCAAAAAASGLPAAVCAHNTTDTATNATNTKTN
jgi:hypothetical protein